jgi:hypothetical protein
MTTTPSVLRPICGDVVKLLCSENERSEVSFTGFLDDFLTPFSSLLSCAAVVLVVSPFEHPTEQ